MNTLVINGSPRGESSNSMRLTSAFLEGAGLTDAELVHLYELEIAPCRGCYSCWTKTPGQCVMRDDMERLMERILAADTVIWSFPLYYYSVPGVVKTTLDRLLPTNLPFMADGESGAHPARYDLSHQRRAVISTCGFWTAQGNYPGVEFIFDRMYGKGEYTKVFCGQGELFRTPELRGRTGEYLEVVTRAGAEFLAGGIKDNTRAELEEPLFPRDVFEKMADASWGISEATGEPTDESLSLTKQMAALYIPDGTERVLEFEYTDIGKRYQMLMSGDGAEVITDGFRPHTTRISTPFTVWVQIARGEVTGQEALFQRKYSVSGDFEVMLKWDSLFGGPKRGGYSNQEDRKRSTRMIALLLPWIVFWAAVPISAEIGVIISIAAAALTPLLWVWFKPVLYEQISIPIVIGLSLAISHGLAAQIVIPISYGMFGLMWLVTAFFKTPLTSHYSANSYGGDSAFDNPLFMKTNRILTAVWGALYILTSVWTYLIMGTALSPYIGIINSVVPAIAGVFTAWYQKWYPAHVAKG